MDLFLVNIINIAPSYFEFISFLIFSLLILNFFVFGKLLTGKAIFYEYNFAIGFYFFVLIYFLLSFILKLNIILYIYFFINFIFLIYFIKKKKININLKKIKFNKKFLLFICTSFIFFISSEYHGWDTFAFWEKRVDFILNNNVFPGKGFFRADYPYSFQLIDYTIKHLVNISVENIPALIDTFILIILISIIGKNLNIKDKNIFYVLYIFLFFNPLIINTNSFSSYHDLKIAFILFLIISFIYEKKILLISEISFKNLVILSILNSLIFVSKNTGIVFFSLISLYFLIINFYYMKYELLKFNNLKKIIVYLVISLSLFVLWKIKLYMGEIDSIPDFKGFRIEFISLIFKNFLNQIFLRKFYLFSLIIFLLIFFNLILYKKQNYLFNLMSLIFTIVIGYKLFLLIFALSFQNNSHALEAHNYWRYYSQLGPIILFGIIIFLKDNLFFLKIVKKFSNLKVNFFMIYLIFIIIFINLNEKMRRDLVNPGYQLKYLFKDLDYDKFDFEKKIYIDFIENGGLNKEIISYYISKKFNKYYDKNKIFFLKTDNSEDFYIIESKNNNIKLKKNKY